MKLICTILVILAFILYITTSPIQIKNFDINMTPFKETRISSDDHNLLLDIMRRLDSLLKESNLPYFMVAGTLLGAVRYSNRMPWDDDIDIGIFDSELFETLPFDNSNLGIQKTYFGYKIFDSTNNRSINLEDHFPFIDVFIFSARNNKYYYSSEEARHKWPKEYLEHDELFPLSELEYSDLKLPCPQKAKKYLSRIFSNWDKSAFIAGSHTGKILFKKYKMPINQNTNQQILKYLQTL